MVVGSDGTTLNTRDHRKKPIQPMVQKVNCVLTLSAMSGRVMRKKIFHSVAPSINAASNRSSGIFFMAAMYTSRLPPMLQKQKAMSMDQNAY